MRRLAVFATIHPPNRTLIARIPLPARSNQAGPVPLTSTEAVSIARNNRTAAACPNGNPGATIPATTPPAIPASTAPIVPRIIWRGLESTVTWPTRMLNVRIVPPATTKYPPTTAATLRKAKRNRCSTKDFTSFCGFEIGRLGYLTRVHERDKALLPLQSHGTMGAD